MSPFVLASLFLAAFRCAGRTDAADLVGRWEFENPSNLGEAAVGTALSLHGSIGATSGIGGGDGAADVTRESYFTVVNPIGANGAAGTPARTNQFSIVLDFQVPDFTDGGADNGNFTGIFDFRQSASDGDYFIRKQGTTELGVSAVGYTGGAGTFAAGTWYRLVYTVDSGGTGRSTYLNGAKIGDNSGNNTIDYTRGSLGTAFGVFQDDTLGEQSRVIVSAIALYDGKLTDTEVAALGMPGDPLDLGANHAPVIAEGESISLPDATLNGPPVNGILNATDADGDPVSWTVGSQASHGNAEIVSSSGSQASIRYTPAPGFTGADSFVIVAGDGEDSDEITVHVNVLTSVVTIAEGDLHTLLVAMDAGPQTITFHASDSAGDPLNWSISSAASHGTAQVTADNNTSGSVTYTPAPGFSGGDTFVVRASNGTTEDEITVSVQVVFDGGNERVFYQENFDSAVLLPEETTGGQRRMPAGDNTPVWNTPGAAGLGLSGGADSFTNDPGDRIVEFAGFNLMRSDFWRNGDDQGRSTAFAPGPNVIAVADSDEFTDGGVTDTTGDEDEFNVFLRTPAFLIPSGADASRMVLTFLSSFRLEQNETSRVHVYLDGSSTPSAVLDVPNNGASAAAPVSFNWSELGSPAEGSIMMLEFAHEDADNNWWWAFDDLFVGIPNQAPEITEGETAALTTGLNVSTQATFHATDDDGDPLTWDVSGPAANGSASIVSSDTSETTVSYTPANGFTGTDAFTVRVSDGNAEDNILVSVSVVNGAPVINEGDSYNLGATKNGGVRSVTFTAVDPNNNPLDWSIASAAAHGTAEVAANNDSEGTIEYTPATDYSGPDAFVVRVSDGVLHDDITVNVTVTDPTADPTLTIVAPFGTATPAAGTYSHPTGTALTNTCTDETGATTRHICTGWTMTGDGPSTGTASTMNLTLTRDSVLTWTFRTEHLVETSVSGNGGVTVNTGWHEAGVPLQINAVPATGHHFTGWTGDTAGCLIGGASLVVPMDRPRSAITANFAADENFTVVALPDTQNYTSISSPSDLFTRQTQWIVDNRETMNIKFVTHLGDVVNSPSSQAQWLRATDAMNLLDNRMPYGTCPGNHDLASGNNEYVNRFGPNPTHSSSTSRWIDPATSQTYDWYRGASPRGYSSYQIVRINSRDFMFLHLDMDAPDQDLAWAASVLDAHPKVLTMVTTHNYLAETGGSGFFGSGTGQRGYTAQANTSVEPDRNRPVEVFNAIVKPYNQVYMVICGHMFAIYNLEKTNDAGNTVHEVLADYQSLPNGGNGFLRIMEFQPSENRIVNTSYSPYLGRYIDPDVNADHQGMLDLHDRNGSEFTLATDFDTRFHTDLTIVSAHGGVSPAAGVHSIETDTPVAISATDVVSGQTRYRPTGWNLAGGQNASGTGSSGVITQGADATLTWSYATQHYLTTATVGDGIVSTNSGWYDEGTNVTIQAQPDAGAAFVQWSGDLDGCTVNGASISVPVDRPRGPVTAEFSSGAPTWQVEVASAYSETTPAPATYTYEDGQTVTFSASAMIEGSDTRRICTGYEVTGATAQSGPGNSVALAITGDLTVTWLWRTQYLLATTASGPGSVTASHWVDENAGVTVTATADAGAGFVTWSGDTALGTANGTQFEIAAMTRPVGPLTASFATSEHTLTIVSAEETTTPPPGTYAYPFGSNVAFSALPAESGASRERPAGWTLTGAAAGSGTEPSGSVVISGDTTLTWTFVPEVLLRIHGGSEGAVLPMNAAGWHPLGENVQLDAVPLSSDFTFRGWTGDVPQNSTSTGITLAMDQPRAVTADFAPLVTDGTPHWWLDRFTTVSGGNYLAARGNDIDGDGQPAWREYLAGMSDLDPTDLFQVRSFAQNPVSGTLDLTFPARELRVYQLAGSASPAGPFLPFGAPLAATPPLGSASFAKPADASRFYRVDVTLGETSVADADPAAASVMPQPGSVVREMVTVPAGSFVQGENTGPTTSRPEHVTHVARFRIDKFEVTRADWESVATWAVANGYDIPVTLPYNQPPYHVPADHPAVAVSWYDAVKWCNARSEMEGRRPVYFTDAAATAVYRADSHDLTTAQVNWAGDGYRLPTESEWEYASRGGLPQARFPWGDDEADLRANHWNYQLFQGRAPDEDYPYTERVGFFDGTQPGGMPDMANGYGLYDMSGNAWEWTWDRMSDYSAETRHDPRGPDTGVERVQRGGSWWNYTDQATNFQRLPFPPDGTDDYGMIGFRCVRAMHPNE